MTLYTIVLFVVIILLIIIKKKLDEYKKKFDEYAEKMKYMVTHPTETAIKLGSKIATALVKKAKERVQ